MCNPIRIIYIFWIKRDSVHWVFFILYFTVVVYFRWVIRIKCIWTHNTHRYLSSSIKWRKRRWMIWRVFAKEKLERNNWDVFFYFVLLFLPLHVGTVRLLNETTWHPFNWIDISILPATQQIVTLWTVSFRFILILINNSASRSVTKTEERKRNHQGNFILFLSKNKIACISNTFLALFCLRILLWLGSP